MNNTCSLQGETWYGDGLMQIMHYAHIRGSFCICAQPMRDDFYGQIDSTWSAYYMEYSDSQIRFTQMEGCEIMDVITAS